MRTMHCLVLLGLAALPLFGADPVTLQGEAKPAWKWTIEERLAARFDVTLAIQRETFDLTEGSRKNASLFSRIDGNEHPELFMPNELFSALMVALEPDFEGKLRPSTRAKCGRRLVEAGVDDKKFWNELEIVTTEYLTLATRRMELLRNHRQDALISGPILCRARATALAAAQQHFGEELFNRLLYTVVPPGLAIGSTPEQATPEHLLFLEGGCQ